MSMPPATADARQSAGAGAAEPERLARLALNHAVEPADALIGRILERHSPERVLAAIHADELADLEADPARRAKLADRWAGLRLRLEPGRVEAGIAAAEAVGARFIIPGDEDWPRQFDDLGELRPVGIWAKGQWPPSAAVPASPSAGAAETGSPVAAVVEMISVVGARACTGYGAYVAGTIGADLASAGVPVVSGAALGIDAAAHRGAVAVGGPTIAVLACGIDRVYPRVHEALLRTIAERGAVLSELPPGVSPTRFRFLHRNRIIAALAVGTVVVEAARRSGSLVTARLAAELGRVVMAVPGPVTSEQSAGVHELIRDGAMLVTDAVQVREACSSLAAASSVARGGGAGRPGARGPSESDELTERGGRLVGSSGLGERAGRSGGRAGSAAGGGPDQWGEPGVPSEWAEPDAPAGRTEPADPVEELVAEALPTARAPAGADVLSLARTAGLSPDTVFAALGRLAASGRAVRSGGGWMLAVSE